MAALDIPFNIELLQLSNAAVARMRPVRVLDFFETASGDFHEDGLFSVSIFGRVGDEMRDRRFSYIDLKTEIFHPVIYERLCQLKNLYKGIMSGEKYAVWDEKQKDFVASNELEGDTGYSFFMRHWKDIQFVRNQSDIRSQRIDLIEKYKDRATTSKVLVLPAGLRDIEIDQSGRMKVGDHNDAYRKLLSIARGLGEYDNPNEIRALDLPRHLMQQAFIELYEGIVGILTGKRGFLQNKWASRRVFDSSRNVITAMDSSVNELDAPGNPKFTDTVLGLWQMSRNVLPKTVHFLRTGPLQDIFSFGDMQARLVRMDNQTAEIVALQSDVYDRWATVEGLEKVIVGFKDVASRTKPVVIGDHYLALVYRGRNPQGQNVFRVFSDINELPEGWDRKAVHPLTLGELLYLSGYREWNNFAGFVTRYPVTGTESIYPSTFFLQTTMQVDARYELDVNWEVIGEDHVAHQYPRMNDEITWQDSMVIPSVKLRGLGADFDGKGIAVYKVP